MTSLTDPSTPNVFVNEYQVTRFPRDHGGTRHFSLWIQYRGAGRWSISRWQNMGPRMTFDKDGVEDYDRSPYNEESDDYEQKSREWRDARRWGSAEEAIEFAKTLLTTLSLAGRWTDEEIMQRDPTGEYT